ncbi:helix-turn-helix domain-containing protein [Blastococcus sp. TF02A-26]|uniref:helix-turn-helix domain-containing protein n=1 Tax=Blastococcus sp. TF02A-26 TaxID=2250577 RepID=UPI000DE892A7|nr:helix-turn-helix domain-containing protein [Blastococcus sp. TF02A-26]RBY84690.1 PucR family transcriptional regulator [Blastococcus sp. TF02A-26]
MNDLALRLAQLDPQASAAVRVVGHFDSLMASRAGLQSIVRGAASLAGCPVRLVDPARRLTVRVLADGVAVPPEGEPDPAWPATEVSADGAVLVLERTGPVGTVEAVVLERAAAAAAAVLARSPSRGRGHDPAFLRVVLDDDVDEAERLAVARRLGLPASCRAVALPDGGALVVAAGDGPPPGQRAGIGGVGGVADLPASWAGARLALRLTAAGTDDDPGPRVVSAESLGALALLVRAADAEPGPQPDVRTLDRAAANAPWVLATLDAVVRADSLRGAARVLRVHHSTLQDRLASAESMLGWDLRCAEGRLRLHLALALRRAARGTGSR